MIPVSILTGFLGAGKTTLVNHILTAKHGKKIAVIENEFGEIGVDDGLVIETKEEIIEMNNGCICCTVRGDLIRIMHKLLKRKDKFDAILIETTGLADPAPVAQTFFMDEKIKQKSVLDAIITVVDAKHILAHLEEKKPEGVENESVEQVAFADKILLNKVDLVNGKMKATVLAKLRSINAFAEIIETSHSKVALDRILGVGAFDLNRVMEMDPTFLDEDSEHQHDSTVTSVGIHVEGEVNLERLSDWLSDLVEEKGADIFRSKGLIAVRGSKDKHVFQGVHMMMSLGSSYDGFGRPWKDGEKRENKLVFIGRNLDREELNNSFRKCLVVPRGSKRRLPGACSTSDRITRSNSRARK